MRILITASTTWGDAVLLEGTEADVPFALARRLIDRGRARPVREAPIEIQVLPDRGEKAVKRRKRKRKGHADVE